MAAADAVHDICADGPASDKAGPPSVRALSLEQWPAGASLDDAQVESLKAGHHGDPASILGRHQLAGGPRGQAGSEGPVPYVFRAWHPRLERDWEHESGRQVVLHLQPASGDALAGAVPMRRRCACLYEAVVELPPDLQRCVGYSVEVPEDGAPLLDAYSLPQQLLSEEDVDELQSGVFARVSEVMGSHCIAVAGVWGLRFVTWAPRALAVRVVGDWNGWDGRASPMCRRCREGGGGFSGLWELFVPFGGGRAAVPLGSRYGYCIHTVHGSDIVKMDPFAQEFERPSELHRVPSTNTSLIAHCDDDFREEPFGWTDAEWISQRDERGRSGQLLRGPMATYEVHLPSWRRSSNGDFMNYREIAPLLVEHVKAMHFNYVELIGLAHHPFTGSWGYQVSGFYGCYSLLGSPDDFKSFVDVLHGAGIGVLMDFVPCHFCKDACSFSDFDGTPTFEYEDPRLGEQYEWGTKIFDFGRNEVRSFLIGAALFWARRYHVDGFRVDAVSCMLYRNFGRKDGEWLPNAHGGDGNLEAMSLLRDLNRVMHEAHPGVIMIAEESTSWEGVTDLRECPDSGLGFDLKWDLGWMNDTLTYLMEPAHNRPNNHRKITCRDAWMHKERFVLPLSHDEVANKKGSLLDKMGRQEHADFYDKVRLLCALYGFQVASPGRPLLFMGQEIGQGREWDYRQSIDWHEGSEPLRGQLCTWLSDLLGVYLHHSPLHAGDDDPHASSMITVSGDVLRSFEWLESNDGACVVAILRRWRRERPVVCICNFSPREHRGYNFRAPYWGKWDVLLNSDDARYGGRGVGPGNMTSVWTCQGGRADCSDSLRLDVPAEGCVLLLAPVEFLENRTADKPSAPQFSDVYFDEAFEYGFEMGG